MSVKATRTPRKRLWIIACVTLPVLYVLSFGPAIWTMSLLIKRFPEYRLFTIVSAVFMIAYTPLEWAAKCLGLEELFLWYARLFI